MGNPAGVRRDFQALEQRRLLGARLLQQGVPQAEVARRVGVHRQSVSRWAQQLQRGGQRALKKAGRALERDEEKIRLWKQKRWPEIKKKPAKRGAPSSSSTRAD